MPKQRRYNQEHPRSDEPRDVERSAMAAPRGGAARRSRPVEAAPEPSSDAPRAAQRASRQSSIGRGYEAAYHHGGQEQQQRRAATQPDQPQRDQQRRPVTQTDRPQRAQQRRRPPQQQLRTGDGYRARQLQKRAPSAQNYKARPTQAQKATKVAGRLETPRGTLVRIGIVVVLLIVLFVRAGSLSATSGEVKQAKETLATQQATLEQVTQENDALQQKLDAMEPVLQAYEEKKKNG